MSGDLPGIGEWRLCEPKNLIYGNCNMDYDNKNMVGYDIFIYLMMVKENTINRQTNKERSWIVKIYFNM